MADNNIINDDGFRLAQFFSRPTKLQAKFLRQKEKIQRENGLKLWQPIRLDKWNHYNGFRSNTHDGAVVDEQFERSQLGSFGIGSNFSVGNLLTYVTCVKN